MNQTPQPKDASDNISESPLTAGFANGAGDGSHQRTKRQTSMVVLADVDNKDEAIGLSPSPPAPERRPPLLARTRKKSVRFAQNEGPPADGEYHNVDYEPRRESSIFRMRAILDRLEPSRPKQDAAIFAALTGAQSIKPTYDLDDHRPMSRDQSCSEDGRLHRCTQQDSVPTSPG